MITGVAKLVAPETCGSEEHCIAVCRDDAIRMAWVPFAGNLSVGVWSERSNETLELVPANCEKNSLPGL
jgi:hypothetical protein